MESSIAAKLRAVLTKQGIALPSQSTPLLCSSDSLAAHAHSVFTQATQPSPRASLQLTIDELEPGHTLDEEIAGQHHHATDEPSTTSDTVDAMWMATACGPAGFDRRRRAQVAMRDLWRDAGQRPTTVLLPRAPSAVRTIAEQYGTVILWGRCAVPCATESAASSRTLRSLVLGKPTTQSHLTAQLPAASALSQGLAPSGWQHAYWAVVFGKLVLWTTRGQVVHESLALGIGGGSLATEAQASAHDVSAADFASALVQHTAWEAHLGPAVDDAAGTHASAAAVIARDMHTAEHIPVVARRCSLGVRLIQLAYTVPRAGAGKPSKPGAARSMALGQLPWTASLVFPSAAEAALMMESLHLSVVSRGCSGGLVAAVRPASGAPASARAGMPATLSRALAAGAATRLLRWAYDAILRAAVTAAGHGEAEPTPHMRAALLQVGAILTAAREAVRPARIRHKRASSPAVHWRGHRRTTSEQPQAVMRITSAADWTSGVQSDKSDSDNEEQLLASMPLAAALAVVFHSSCPVLTIPLLPAQYNTIQAAPHVQRAIARTSAKADGSMALQHASSGLDGTHLWAWYCAQRGEPDEGPGAEASAQGVWHAAARAVTAGTEGLTARDAAFDQVLRDLDRDVVRVNGRQLSAPPSSETSEAGSTALPFAKARHVARSFILHAWTAGVPTMSSLFRGHNRATWPGSALSHAQVWQDAVPAMAFITSMLTACNRTTSAGDTYMAVAALFPREAGVLLRPDARLSATPLPLQLQVCSPVQVAVQASAAALAAQRVVLRHALLRVRRLVLAALEPLVLNFGTAAAAVRALLGPFAEKLLPSQANCSGGDAVARAMQSRFGTPTMSSPALSRSASPCSIDDAAAVRAQLRATLADSGQPGQLRAGHRSAASSCHSLASLELESLWPTGEQLGGATTLDADDLSNVHWGESKLLLCAFAARCALDRASPLEAAAAGLQPLPALLSTAGLALGPIAHSVHSELAACVQQPTFHGVLQEHVHLASQYLHRAGAEPLQHGRQLPELGDAYAHVLSLLPHAVAARMCVRIEEAAHRAELPASYSGVQTASPDKPSGPTPGNSPAGLRTQAVGPSTWHHRARTLTSAPARSYSPSEDARTRTLSARSLLLANTHEPVSARARGASQGVIDLSWDRNSPRAAQSPGPGSSAEASVPWWWLGWRCEDAVDAEVLGVELLHAACAASVSLSASDTLDLLLGPAWSAAASSDSSSAAAGQLPEPDLTTSWAPPGVAWAATQADAAPDAAAWLQEPDHIPGAVLVHCKSLSAYRADLSDPTGDSWEEPPPLACTLAEFTRAWAADAAGWGELTEHGGAGAVRVAARIAPGSSTPASLIYSELRHELTKDSESC